MDHRQHNRRAWDRKVGLKDRWTVPVGPAEIAAARRGRWSILLTPNIPVPRSWFPRDMACDLLCLAGAGGQQGPILAATGARVTVLDISEAQLGQDRLVAGRDGLDLRTVQGDMADLGEFADASFDVIVHPVACCFIDDVRPMWREAARVLRPGGLLLAGFMNPAHYIFDFARAEQAGVLEVRHTLPYSDEQGLSDRELAEQVAAGEAVEFSHTLADLIGGQCEAGLVITDLYEDRFGPDHPDPLSRHMPTLLATRARKD